MNPLLTLRIMLHFPKYAEYWQMVLDAPRGVFLTHLPKWPTQVLTSFFAVIVLDCLNSLIRQFLGYDFTNAKDPLKAEHDLNYDDFCRYVLVRYIELFASVPYVNKILWIAFDPRAFRMANK